MKSFFYVLKRWAARATGSAAPLHFLHMTSELDAPLHFLHMTSELDAPLHFLHMTSHPY